MLDLSMGLLLSFTAFRTWISTLQHSLQLKISSPNRVFHSAPHNLRKIGIQSVDFFGERIGFIRLKAEVANDDSEKLPGSMLLRGDSVGMMVYQLQTGLDSTVGRCT